MKNFELSEIFLFLLLTGIPVNTALTLFSEELNP